MAHPGRDFRAAVLACWILVVGTAALSQQKPLLKHSFVGTSSCDVKPCWNEVSDKVEVQRLFLDLADGPRDAAYIDKLLAGTGVTRRDLEELRLLRQDGSQYFLNFTLFTAQDIARVRAVGETFARSLADAVLARQAEIEAVLRSHPAPGQDPKAIAYIVLGCFSLDWDGLKLTAEKGYRKTAEHRPDGDYVPYAEEISDNSRQRIYWGSHYSAYGNMQLMSFGDHFSPRYSLPDLFWRVPYRVGQDNLPEALRTRTSEVVEKAMDKIGEQSGRMLLALRTSGKLDKAQLAHAAGMKPSEADPVISLLAELDYIHEENGRYRANVPVFSRSDYAMVTRLRRIGWEVMDVWLAENYDKIKAELGDTTPTRSGVPYSEGFTQIWHYVFGIANRQLVEAGLFADPYAESRKFKGFIPTVFYSSLTERRP